MTDEIPPLPDIATLPSSITPQRDLWLGIAARIDDGVAECANGHADVSPQPRARHTRRAWARRGAVLAPLLAAAVAVAVVVVSHEPADGVATTVDAGTQRGAGGVDADDVAPDLKAAFAAYRDAAAQLERALATKRGELPPSTQQAIDENLRLIDGALADIDAALTHAGSPDPTLVALAQDTWSHKIALLETALRARHAAL